MSDISSNNKRIAKNTLFLYARMLLIMLVTLYTSRVILATLGASDFGTLSVVGGVVVLFSFLNSSMVSATQRFLNYEMGKGTESSVEKVFSMSVNCHLLIAISIIILGETVGLWFLNNRLNIPADRMTAANWVYQFSIITTCINVFYAPYNATIIACEKMSVYAYVSSLEVIFKLLIVYLLNIWDFDKLILYSILLAFVAFSVASIYISYCLRNFSFCHYKFCPDKRLFTKMISFSGWSLLGGASNIGATQGINMILNIVFGVVVNAAMGIANQVTNALVLFVNNFATAFNPQIVKSYAAGEKEYFNKLLHTTSRVCYFLFYTLSLPIIVYCEEILTIWLGEIPDYSVRFCQIVILISLVDAINTPLWTAVRANGNIKKYNIVTSCLRLSTIPITYLGFKLGQPPIFALLTNLTLNIIIQSWVIYHLKCLVGLNIKDHLRNSIFPCIVVSLISLPFPILLHKYGEGIIWDLFSIAMTIVVTCVIIFFLGIKKNERNRVVSIVKSKIFKNN